MATREQYDNLVQGLQILSGHCDGAVEEDGVGFNGTDTHFGKSLAAQATTTVLSPGQQRPAIKLIQKYRNQLAGYGFTSLPTMAEYGEPFGDVVIDGPKKAEVEIWGEDGKIRFRANFNIVPNKDKVKTLPWASRRFDSATRTWVIDPKVGADLLAMFPDADVDPRVKAYVEGTTQVKAEDVEDPRPVQMVVRLVKNRVVMRTPDCSREQFMVWLADQKAVPDRKFNDTKKEGKFWSAPTSAIPWIVENWADREDIDLGQELLDAHQNLLARAEMSRAAHGELVDELPIPDGLVPFPYQMAGYNFLKHADFRALLADDMGLGKTIQAIMAIMAVRHEGPVVVSCPATVKLNWKREMEKWIPGIRVLVLDGRTPKFALDVNQYDAFVINHDILATRDGNGFKGWIDQFLALNISLVIFDEGHKVGNPKSIRGGAARAIAKEVDRVIVLTGTPLPNRPKELWPILNMIDPDAWGNFFTFGKRYCNGVQGSFGWDFSGASNLDELHERIKPWVLRRTKDQVLTELPGKSRVDIVLQLPKALRKKYDARVAQFANKVRSGYVAPHERLTLISDLKQLAAEAKLKQAIDWILDFVESGQKLIVFAWHKATIQAVMDALAKAKVGAVKLTGETPVKKRQEVVDAFQTDPDTQVFVGNIQAAGEGITLTAASDVVFLEYGWKPGEHAQAEDRANRIGQEYPVTVWYLNAQGTIDGELFQVIDGKRQVIDMVMEGETQAHQSDVLVMGEDTKEWTDQDLVTALALGAFK